MEDKVTELSLQFVRKYFPESKLVILAGSYASFSQTKGSDIDIALTSDKISERVVDNIYDSGVMFDVIVFPEQRIDEYLYDIRKRPESGPIFSYLAGGQVIFDPLGIGPDLLALANHYFRSGFDGITAENLFLIERTIQRQIIYLDRIDDLVVRRLTMGYIIDLYSSLKVYVSLGWQINPGKWRIKFIKKFDPDFYRLTSEYIRQSEPDDEQNLITYVKAQLRIVSGEFNLMPYRFSENILNTGRHLIVAFKSNLPYWEFIARIIAPLRQVHGPLYFYQQVAEIIVVFKDVKDEPQPLLDLVNRLALDQRFVLQYYTRNHTLPKLHFGGSEAFLLIEELFAQLCVILSALNRQRLIDNGNKLGYLIYCYFGFVVGCEYPKNRYQQFNDYLLDRALTKSYDIRLEMKFDTIAKQRQIVLSNYEKVYTTNTGMYEGLFSAYFHDMDASLIEEPWLQQWITHAANFAKSFHALPDIVYSPIQAALLSNYGDAEPNKEWIVFEKILDLFFDILSIPASDQPYVFFVVSKLLAG